MVLARNVRTTQMWLDTWRLFAPASPLYTNLLDLQHFTSHPSGKPTSMRNTYVSSTSCVNFTLDNELFLISMYTTLSLKDEHSRTSADTSIEPPSYSKLLTVNSYKNIYMAKRRS